MFDRSSLERLEQRVRIQQDIEAIESLKARYWRAIDRKRPDDVERCFVPNAIVDFEGLEVFSSRDAFLALVRHEAAKTSTYNMHHGQNPHITVTGPESAVGEWDIFYCGIDTVASTLVQMAGVYHDVYIRKDGEWLIASTQMRSTSMQVRHVGVNG